MDWWRLFGLSSDTAFMYMIGCLIMVKIYQTRHPDVNAHAHSAYCFIALIVFMGVMGVVCPAFSTLLICSFFPNNWWTRYFCTIVLHSRHFWLGDSIGVGAQSTLGGQDIFARNYMHKKLTKCLNFTWYLPEKFKIPECLRDICPKNIIFPNFWGHVPPLPPPVSYAYGRQEVLKQFSKIYFW